MSQLQDSQAGGIPLYLLGRPATLFYPGVSTLGITICFTQSTDLSVNLTPKDTLTDTPKILFDQISEQPVVWTS